MKDTGFKSIVEAFPNINFYFQSSKFTYHNKIVDSVIRTLRNALFNFDVDNPNKYWNGKHDEIIQQLVEYYNHTWHRMIKMTPHEMHVDIDKEWKYIRAQIERLGDAKKKQKDAGLFNYKPGDRLLIHLDYGKLNPLTTREFRRRRNFDRFAKFVRYQNGNCLVQLEKPIKVDKTVFEVVEIPIYFTKLSQ